MTRKALYLQDEQIKILSSWQHVSFSEHIRRAIDDYIEKEKGKIAATTSPSKGGIKNGTGRNHFNFPSPQKEG